MATAIIKSALSHGVQTKDALLALKRRVAGVLGGQLPPTAELRRAYDTITKRDPRQRSETLEKILVRREVRSLSGVAVITVLTKPWPCPGRCVYCPSEARMPKSYLANEPAAMRAVEAGFDPSRQVATRLRSLYENGHLTDKLELIVKGGSWSAYPRSYQDWFIGRCFEACNEFNSRQLKSLKAQKLKSSKLQTLSSKLLNDAQRLNETARNRVIGLTLETRPDLITPNEIANLRRLGCTRVELGVQTLDDRVLKLVRRGHDAAAVARATRLLKAAGFKTDYHLMPQLPGATPRSDLVAIRRVFADPDFRPDMIKIYPCVVLKSAELHRWWRAGRYRPYANRHLLELLVTAKPEIPRYCRISRLIRDIPAPSVEAGNTETNLRQRIQAELKRRGHACPCLRCREIGHAAKEEPRLLRAKPKLFDDAYEASGGTEHFLSFEDARRRAVFAFCRLRLPGRRCGETERRRDGETSQEIDQIEKLLPELREAALLRELHTYGHLVPIAKTDSRASQHRGLGRRLMAKAERLAAAAGFEKMAVIAGVGVRGYYRQLGYRLQGSYMVKWL